MWVQPALAVQDPAWKANKANFVFHVFLNTFVFYASFYDPKENVIIFSTKPQTDVLSSWLLGYIDFVNSF